MAKLAKLEGRDINKFEERKMLLKEKDDNKSLSIDRIGTLSDAGVMRLVNQNLTSELLSAKLESYFTFIVVRHPLSRLVSGFFDKMKKPSRIKESYAKHIIMKYRDKPPEVIDKSDVYFDEFVQYVSEPDDQLLGGMDDHWRTVTNLCHPCHIRYDYIGKMETIEEDVNNIVRLINKPVKRLQIRQVNSQKQFKSSYSDAYVNVTKTSLTKLIEKYSEDMDMFSYTPEEFFDT